MEKQQYPCLNPNCQHTSYHHRDGNGECLYVDCSCQRFVGRPFVLNSKKVAIQELYKLCHESSDSGLMTQLRESWRALDGRKGNQTNNETAIEISDYGKVR